MIRIPQSRSAEPAQPTTRRTDDLTVTPFTILYDRREREGGWRFGEIEQAGERTLVRTREIHMVTADYTVETADGVQLPCLVERKSHDDLIGSCGGGHERLRAEFERMRQVVAAGGHCCLICESSLDRIVDDLSDPAGLRRLKPNSILGILASWPQQFGVPILFAGSRRLAEQLTFLTLKKFHDRALERPRVAQPDLF